MPGGKVGGVGDVIRDLPAAVAALGWQATVLTPSYGLLHRIYGATHLGSIDANFRGARHNVDVWRAPGSQPQVQNIVLDHARLAPTVPGVIYHQDPGDGPFAVDAEKFAFFGAAAAAWIASLDASPAALHLHDWHTGVLATLRQFDPAMIMVQKIRTVFTIHNLSYQGQRPFSGAEASFETWFPELEYERSSIADPVATDCFNPMATCIRFADAVNTVSPSYCKEIQEPSNEAHGFIGGEGLETDINRAYRDGRLTGILNGCDYSEPATAPLMWHELVAICARTLRDWTEQHDSELHELAAARVSALPGQRPRHIVSSVGRIVAQKMRLFFQRTESGRTALEEILIALGPDNVMLLLGNGEARYEEQIAALANDYPNLVFLHGYSEALGAALYSSGDLFLMPSSFEPCGISQMIAMKNGQPCVVHAVGGLRDTIDHGETGFVFDGKTALEKATNFVATTARALTMRDENPRQWEAIQTRARARRFDWETSAQHYIRRLYEHRL